MDPYNKTPNQRKLARSNRTQILRDKRANYLRSISNVTSPSEMNQIPNTQSSDQRTPSGDITSNVLNGSTQHTQISVPTNNSESVKNTQPSNRHTAFQKRTRNENAHSLGVNLMSRFTESVANWGNQYADPNVNSGEGSSSQGNNHTTNRPKRRKTTHQHFGYAYTNRSNEPQNTYADFYETQGDDADIYSEDDDQTATGSESFLMNHNEGYYDIGDPLIECKHCGACMWYEERTRKHRHTAMPTYELCCGNGRVELPLLLETPAYLKHLVFDNHSRESKNYQENIRTYNMMFAFTSPGAKLDRTFNNGRGPPTIRIQGQPCHRIGSMLPMPGKSPKFAQLYIYDTENEVQQRIEGLRNKDKIDEQIVIGLSKMLDQYNTHAKSFRMAKNRLAQGDVPNLKLKLISGRNTDGRVNNLPSVSEVAALIVGDVDTATGRDIIMETRSGELQRVDELHASYLAYQYPLIFPRGEDGFRENIFHRERPECANRKRNTLTCREWISFRIQTRKEETHILLHSRKLFHQFLVDAYSILESERLKFIRFNQSKLRVDKYRTLNEGDHIDQTQGSNKGKRIILPSTFVGSRRYMDQLYFDGMAICSFVGFPDLFLTFTCNPNWPEILRLVTPLGLKPHDRPDIITRVFKMKFHQLLSDLTKRNVLGKVLAYMYTIEFQKRGLPHAHLLIFLHPSNKYPSPDDIDKIISAEIPNPDQDTELYDLVKSHMIHGPCGRSHRSSPCMKDGKCSRYFPKDYQNTTIVDQDGYPVYRRRNNSHHVVKNGVQLDSRNVVPYNPFFLRKYQAHINMEWCNQTTSVKYLFKYINKGYDRITAVIEPAQQQGGRNERNLDEIKQYLDCRYVSPCEACWRIFKFPIHGRKPAVERLHFHLPGEQSVYFEDNDDIEEILSKPTVSESMFTAWMNTNKIFDEGRNLTYAQYLSKFVYVKRSRTWKPRKSGYTIGRLMWVPPSTGELFYLRMMLAITKGATSYEDLRTINNIQYSSFREACFALGLLTDDKEYVDALKEAKDWGVGFFLRKLFVTILLSGTMNRPEQVWIKTWQWLADGILYSQRRLTNNQGLQLSDEQLMNLTLVEIQKLLEANRRSLRDFPCMPYPDGYVTSKLGNRLIYDELDYDKETLRVEFQNLYSSLTDEQRGIFETIMEAVNHQKGEMIFLSGYGGTGKTFMWKTTTFALRSEGHIVLTVASSAIASLLLSGGRTAHSKFKIPVPTLDNSTCNIHQGSELAELIKQTKLIIWDEAPMSHKYCFEALDRSLRDIMNKPNTLFGGKVVVFGGDFRQILPVIPRGSRSDIVHSTINASYLWEHCKLLSLTQNMRLKQGLDNSTRTELANFAKWILDVGEGKISEPNDGFAEIEIPEELLILDFEDPIAAIVKSTYPDLLSNYEDVDYLHSRAILASTIEVVDEINKYVLGLISGEEKEYFSSDSVDMTEATESEPYDVLTPEFLNSLSTSGLPNHHIKLKVGCPIMLLRNLDQAEGLCNGTRFIVTRLANHVIGAKIISGKNIGNEVYIPRMSMSPSQSPWPFKMVRRQFPIVVSYAMTINKSQGQTLANVGLYLPRPVFSHGQLYVAFSRVQSKQGLKILIHDKDKKPLKSTTNVVFKEVFQNL